MRWNGVGTAGAAVFAVLWVVAGCTDPTGSEDSSRSLRTGDRNAHNAGGAGFHMRFVADGLTCPAGLDDLGEATVDAAFWIGETEVTYELWYEVRTWAEGNWYIFQNEGVEGKYGTPGSPPTADRNHPVTYISWRDAMVWTNALTEYYNEQYNANLECVYTFDGTVIRGSHNANQCDNAVAGEEARGFRLLTSAEWELAARYIGTNQPADEPLKSEAILKDGTWWTPGSYAAGATADYQNVPATWEAAWYKENSGNSTNEVGQKPPDGTGLGLYDMSGNVLQWCFDWHPDEPGTQRVFRGGSWDYSAGHLQVGREASNTPAAMDVAFGFRLARTQ